jgi:hypothetical protein
MIKCRNQDALGTPLTYKLQIVNVNKLRAYPCSPCVISDRYRFYSFENDQLICTQCQGNMRIIAFIEDAALIQVIANHLGLWETKNYDPPSRNSSHTSNVLTVDES